MVKSFADGKNVFVLTSEGTFRTLISSSISPDTIFSQASPKRLRIILRDGNGTFLYLVQLEREEQLKQLLQVLNQTRINSCKSIIESLNGRLPLEPTTIVKKGDIFESKVIGQQEQLFITAGSTSVAIGPCMMSIVRSGKTYVESTRLIIRSLYTHTKVLETTFLESNWHIRKVDTDSKIHRKEADCMVILRIFGKEDVDYQFKISNADDFIILLQQESQQAQNDEEYRLKMVQLEEELKRKKEEEFSFSVLKSLFELQIKEAAEKVQSVSALEVKVEHTPAPLATTIQDTKIVSAIEDTKTPKRPIEMVKIDSKFDEPDHVKKQSDDDDATLELNPFITVMSNPKVENAVKTASVRPVYYGGNSSQKYENHRLYNRFIALLEENLELRKEHERNLRG
jgi:hypothetical protein